MKKTIFVIFSAAFVLTGCGGKHNNPTPSPDPALLSEPALNSLCTVGTVLSATQSSLQFTWYPANNSESYNLVIKNLLTSDSTIQVTSQPLATMTLLRNTPYEWYVVSLSSKTSVTAKSANWKFYNSGPGAVTYAPFPATISSPTFAQVVTSAAGIVNLTWTGSVVSPDVIANYDVYFGTTNTPAITASAITNSFLNNVTVLANATYYWKVITRDVAGNTSDSGLYQFTVN